MVVISATILVVRIMHGTVQRRLILFEILSFALAVRVVLFFSAVVYGPDLIYHGISGYMLRTGGLILASTHYYHWYPSIHLLVAVGRLVAGLPVGVGNELSLFLFTGLVETLTLPAIYLLCLHLGVRRRPALLTVLAVAVSGGVLQHSTKVLAQAYTDAIFVVPLALLVRRRSRSMNVLLILLTAVALAGHPVILAIAYSAKRSATPGSLIGLSPALIRSTTDSSTSTVITSWP